MFFDTTALMMRVSLPIRWRTVLESAVRYGRGVSPKTAALPVGRRNRGEPVLTIRQPWASAIFLAGKDVENRGWSTPYRGRLWIHAGLHPKRNEPDRWARRKSLWLPPEPLERGVILGSVELMDIVRDAESPWALRGHWHWLLRSPRLLVTPVAWTGGLTLKWIRPPQGKSRPARRSRKSYPTRAT